MTLLEGAMRRGRHDFCSREHRYARTSHWMGSTSLSWGVDLSLAQEISFFEKEHGPPTGSEQEKESFSRRFWARCAA